jgi:multidrug efflux system outer membrane protein
MKYYKILLVLPLIGVLTSCKVTRDYARPELKLPVSFSDSVETTQSPIPVYADYFTNRELVVLIDSVMANNFDLAIASQNILASEAMMKSVKLNYLPDINLQVNTGLQRLSKNSMMGSFAGSLLFEDYSFGPTFSWEVDFWGKLKRQREEALATYLSQGEAQRGLRVQLIAQTAQLYFNLLSLDEQLQITREVETAMAKTLELLQVQYAVGDVNVLAIKQSEAQLAETRALIPEIKASIAAQENALSALAGNYPGVLNKRSGSLGDTSFSGLLSAGVPADLLTNRPDVKQSELLLRAANARVGMAKANFYPALKITGQGGLNSIRATDWFSIPASLFGNATAGLTQPIFNRRSIKTAYEQAQSQREVSVLEFRKAVVNAVEEVSTVLSAIDHIKAQVAENTNRTEAMRTAIEDAQVLFNYGEATYLEVLTVQQSYFQAKMVNTVTTLKEINAYIALYKSIGGN